MIDVVGRIFVYAAFVDMRKSINGLSILVHVSGHDFDGGGFYVFLNKARDDDVNGSKSPPQAFMPKGGTGSPFTSSVLW